MIEAPTVFLAFTAGFLSFLSPCCLPLVPGYLATITGSATAGAVDQRRTVVLTRAMTFVGTFSLLFILLGLSATAAGSLLRDNRPLLELVSGIVIVLLGTYLLASLFVVRLNRQVQSSRLLDRAGAGSPVLAGAAFALAWTPCVGPTLGAILGLAATSASSGQGGLLLAVYALGLGVPFLLSAAAFERTSAALGTLRRHHVALQATAATVLIGMGVLVLSGELFRLNIEAQRLLSRLGLDLLYNI